MAVQTRIKLRRATAAVWGNVNPVLALGEPGFEVDTNKLKIGNGTDAWATLDYASGGASVFVGTTAPVDPEPNSLWWNSETGGLYILYGTTWVDASPAVAGPQGPQGIQGPVGPQGPQGEPGTPADSSALIPNSIIDAAGDLIVGSAADTPARLALGTNGQVLTSNGTTATWANPAVGGGMTLLSTTTMSGSTTTVSSIPQTYKHLLIVVNAWASAQGAYDVLLKLNGTGDFRNSGVVAGVARESYGLNYNGSSASPWSNDSTAPGSAAIWINDYTSSVSKAISAVGLIKATSTFNLGGTYYGSTAAITSIGLNIATTTWAGGTIKLYGVN